MLWACDKADELEARRGAEEQQAAIKAQQEQIKAQQLEGFRQWKQEVRNMCATVQCVCARGVLGAGNAVRANVCVGGGSEVNWLE